MRKKLPPTTHQRIRERLLARRAELELRSREANADLRHQNEPLAADFADQVTQRENDDVLGAVHQSALAEAVAIAAALRRLEEGEYGDCTRCGGDIEPARLDAVLYTTLCIRCAGAAELELPRAVARSAY